MNKLLFSGLLVAASALFCSCNTVNQNENSATTALPEPPRETPKPLHRGFEPWVLKGNDSLQQRFKKQFTPQELHLIWSINRIDASHFHQADTLLVPDTFVEDFLSYSPFPFEVSALHAIKKVALFSYAIQAYGLYENGYLVKWGPTSMGSKAHPTPQGLYFTNWKGEEVQSTFDDEWILRWNFNIENKEGIGWHQYTLPGYPASHSCLRLLATDARQMYDWAEEWILQDEETVLAKGTPVIVFGQYGFGERKPWMHLVEDPKANNLSEANIEAVVEPFITEMTKEQANRKAVLAKQEEEKAMTKSD